MTQNIPIKKELIIQFFQEAFLGHEYAIGNNYWFVHASTKLGWFIHYEYNNGRVHMDLPLVAHNARFDEGCLRAVFMEYGMEYPGYKFHCTLDASRRCLKLPNHQLHTVSAACGYDLEHHHHALADAEACAAIALKILDE